MRAMSMLGLALALVLTGCAGDSDDRSSAADDGIGSSSASCVLRVLVDGKEWSGLSMKKPLGRRTVNTSVLGVLPGCDDMGGDDQGAGPGQQVTLKPIEGISPDEVLFLPNHDLNDQIFVPGMDVPFELLSPEIQELIQKG